ncbi:unnamed protein product, partial [Eretmochelys imbricata]
EAAGAGRGSTRCVTPARCFSQTLLAAEPCAAPRCRLPQDETVQWVQCDGCDAWFHVACVGCSYSAVQEADFRCGGCRT